MENENEEMEELLDDELEETEEDIFEDNESEDDDSEEKIEPEDNKDLKKEIATLKKQKEHWRNKAQKESSTEKSTEKSTETPVEQSKDEAPLQDNERLDRMELNSLDVRDSEEQDIVITQARARGISLSEAVKNPAVLFEIKELQDKVKAKEAMQISGRKEGKATSIDAKLARFQRTGKLPDDEDDMYAILNASRK